MKDKRFLKVKKVSEERYFRDNREFIRFIEKQGGMTWGEMCDMYERFITVHKNKEIAKRFWETRMNLDREILVIGKFLFRIFRGYYERKSGDYTINILAEQRADLLTGNDINKLFMV